jgi:putative phage-type endonuclease
MLSKEQKEIRRKGIGGSDVASVLGLPPYGCSLKLWFDKTGVEADFEEMNPNMERGIYLEDIAVDFYTRLSGNVVTNIGQTTDDDRPYMMANVDRMIKQKPGMSGQGVLEVKCPSKESFLRMLTDGIPEAYILQGQHYMYVTGADWMEYAIFCADMWKMEIIHVDRDEKLIQLILDSEDHFWKLVQNGPKPERLDFGDSRCKKCDWRLACWKALWEEDAFNYESKDSEYEEDATDELAELFEEHRENVAIAKSAEALKEETKKKLETMVGDRRKVQCSGGKICFKWETKKYINTKKMELEHSELVESYRYESGSKPFRFYPRKVKV